MGDKKRAVYRPFFVNLNLYLGNLIAIMRSASRNYYSSPQFEHATGDIWKDLPSFGLLKTAQCSGIVITPACDLANSKVETVTYLPIVPISYFFCSRSFYPFVKAEAINQIKSLGIEQFDDSLLPKNQLPQESAIKYIAQILDGIVVTKKNVDALAKIKAGIKLIEQILSNTCSEASMPDLNLFFGKKHSEIKDRIIKNSFSTDLHFSPKDGESIEWSAIPNHSVILFRYPITVPIEILDVAMDYNVLHWQQTMDSYSNQFSSAKGFRDKKPLKSLKLNQEYLSDLLTRFVALYVRLGSPDFDSEAIKTILTEI